jgi:pimeloyl-ACP methyl ester carboxylesterase
MTMVVSHKQRIHYRFEGEKGAYLLLHHGLFGSQQDWYDAGYVDALRDEFRLIVMDARGHGRSDHPLLPEDYRLGAFADDVVAIMDELDIRNLHFLGYSLGALVGFELLLRHPERVRIVMLAGESPFVSEALLAEWSALAEAVPREGLRAVQERLLAGLRLAAAPQHPEEEGEQPAAVALLQGLAREVPRPDEGRISVNSPVALFAGEDDPALERMRDARRRIHRARFVSFPGQSHAGLFRQRELLIAEMLRLLRPSRRPEDGQAESADNGDPRIPRGARGRFGRGRMRGEPAPASAPLTPPPPVEVPEREGTFEAAPAAGPAPRAESEPPAAPAAHPPADGPAAEQEEHWAAESEPPAAPAVHPPAGAVPAAPLGDAPPEAALRDGEPWDEEPAPAGAQEEDAPAPTAAAPQPVPTGPVPTEPAPEMEPLGPMEREDSGRWQSPALGAEQEEPEAPAEDSRPAAEPEREREE